MRSTCFSPRFLETLSPRLTFSLAVLVAVGTSGCSSLLSSSNTAKTVRPANPPTPSDSLSRSTSSGREHLDIFVARGFLGGADYERYVLKDGVLWRECGAVTTGEVKSEGALTGDDILHRDPNLDLQERRVELLSPEQLSAVFSAVKDLSEALSQGGGVLPKPGSVHTLSGPGVFELHLALDGGKQRVLTSVDGVANGESSRLRALRKVFQVVRDQGPVICKSRSFFGM